MRRLGNVTEPEDSTLRSEDVQSLADKLEPFINELPDQEKQVLGWILVRAKSVGSATPHAELPPAIATGLAQAAGFEEAPGQALRGSEISVTWKHSFAA
jgi:hypothetical protein